MNEFEIDYLYNDKEYKNEEWAMPVVKDEDCIKNMIQPNEIVTTATEITINFNYPLTTPVDFTYKSAKGFTRKKFWECINKGYTKIYKDEEKDVGNPGNIPGMCNRARSAGPYGIWGHCMGDLVVEGVTKEKNIYHLHIGS